MTVYYYMQQSKKRFYDWLIVGGLLFAAIASLASDSLNTIALYGALPFVFIICFVLSKQIFPNKYQTILTFLYLWETISFIWAYYPEMTMRELHRVLGAFLLSYIMSIQGSRPNMQKWMYLVYLVLYLCAWYYASTNQLIVTDFSEEERLNNEKLNANTMAYYTFYVTIVFFFISEFLSSGFWERLSRVSFFLMIPLSFLVALTTASRQVLIIQVPLFVSLLWIKYLKTERTSKKLLFLILTTIALVVLIPKFFDVYSDSFLAERASKSLKEDSHSLLLKDSFQVGIEHLPLGVGAGNYIMFSKTRHFSHNSFAELFANTGIIGVVLYAALLLIFIRRQWQRYRITKDNRFLYFLVFGIVFLLDQAFYVFYLDLWLMSFFILVATHSESFFQANYKQPKLGNNIYDS